MLQTDVHLIYEELILFLLYSPLWKDAILS